jgi:MoaA/NifB/PqqE/SkfB family radical SAM enzyme
MKALECSVVVTYRCNAGCHMCNTWANPSKSSEEFKPEILEKLPSRISRLNITGGEPALREDLAEIVAVLDKRTPDLEISTNGYFTDRLLAVARQYPHLTFRVSVEGLPKLNDELRGIKDGFDHGLRTLLGLKALGVKNIGFAIVISQHNIYDLLSLYELASGLGVEFAQATMHNSFYFHKTDNKLENLDAVRAAMQEFMIRLLTSRRGPLRMRVKDWFRAYINMGILRYMEGKVRAIPCSAATDFFFVDPWGKILACNGSEEPWAMGDLTTQSFDEIWGSPEARRVRELVKCCERNCWMTGSAVPAMRNKIWIPISWVVKNKLRLMSGKHDLILD